MLSRELADGNCARIAFSAGGAKEYSPECSETPGSYLRKSVNPCQGVTETVQHHEVMSTEMTTTTK